MNNQELILEKLEFDFQKLEFDFQKLQLYTPNNFNLLSLENQKEIYEYLESLNEIEKKAYNLSTQHLKTSFNVLKSNGYLYWKQKK